MWEEHKMAERKHTIPKAVFDVVVSQMEGADNLTYTVETVQNYGPKKDREGHYLSFWTLKEVDNHYILEKTIIGENNARAAVLGAGDPVIDQKVTVFGVEDKTNNSINAENRLLTAARTFAQEYATKEFAQVKDLTLEQRTK